MKEITRYNTGKYVFIFEVSEAKRTRGMVRVTQEHAPGTPAAGLIAGVLWHGGMQIDGKDVMTAEQKAFYGTGYLLGLLAAQNEYDKAPLTPAQIEGRNWNK